MLNIPVQHNFYDDNLFSTDKLKHPQYIIKINSVCKYALLFFILNAWGILNK